MPEISVGLYTNQKVAVIDDIDYELIVNRKWHTFSTTATTYAYCWDPYPKMLLMHRSIMNPPENRIVDHVNRNGLDNRRSNLRVGTQSDNVHAASKDAKGYHWETSRCKWKAMITINGKPTYLGRFDTESEASAAYQKVKQEILVGIFGDEDGTPT
jgi:hypothetical protein